MSVNAICAALETQLDGMSPALSTAWENRKFTPPNKGTAWQECRITFLEPINSALGAGYHQEHGVMTIALHYPIGKGRKDALDRAELIRTSFARGTTLVASGITTLIDKTPKVGQPETDTDRNEWILPVSIRFHADIFA